MRFIVDSMLGRLARWLRILGYDTLYFPHIEDRILLKIAREDNRILLTRDTRLVKIRGLRDFLLLRDNNPFEQLKKVIERFRLRVDSLENIEKGTVIARCILCNATLNIINKEEVKEIVPEYVYQTSEVFKHCSKCGKIYWKGTHPQKFREKLTEILQN
jgi:hypothetical protein